MNKCLCCHQDIEKYSNNGLWHNKCIKKFFNSSVIPPIEISDDKLKVFLFNNINKKAVIPGVQKKMSLGYTKGRNKRLTMVNYPFIYILKPEINEYPQLPELEHLSMYLAEIVGIKVSPHALLKNDGKYAYITKRVDRIYSSDNKIIKLAMEDFCQLGNRLTEDKYKSSYEQCGKIIDKYSKWPALDKRALFLQVVFSFIIGNSDMHLKNLSLLETEYNSNEFTLSPAYDLLAVKVILPEDKEDLALTVNGKKQKITKNDFIKFGLNIGIDKSNILKLIKMITSKKDNMIDIIKDSLLSDEIKNKLINIIIINIGRLS